MMILSHDHEFMMINSWMWILHIWCHAPTYCAVTAFIIIIIIIIPEAKKSLKLIILLQ